MSIALCGCDDNQSSQIETIVNVSALEFQKAISTNGIILDVRTPEEVNRGHLKNATIINFYDKDFKDKAKLIPKDKEVYVYCLSGGRSSEAANILADLGQKKIFNLTGGINAWLSEGLPTTQPKQEVNHNFNSLGADELETIINSFDKVLIDFHTKWCAPCKKMSPIIDELHKELKGQVKIVKFDLDLNKELAKIYEIKAIPTFLFFENGELKWREVGLVSKAQLRQGMGIFAMSTSSVVDIRQAEIIEEFEMFPDWMEKYEHIIEIGKELDAIDEKSKVDDNLIKGCQSRVWLAAELNEEGKVIFTADSDAIITKGLVALMIRVLSDATPVEIAESNLHFLEAIGLNSHLSPTRSNGLFIYGKADEDVRFSLFSTLTKACSSHSLIF